MALLWEHFLNQKQKAPVHWWTGRAERRILSQDGLPGGIFGLPREDRKLKAEATRCPSVESHQETAPNNSKHDQATTLCVLDMSCT